MTKHTVFHVFLTFVLALCFGMLTTSGISAQTSTGTGGKTITVTNLASAGPGSFTEALDAASANDEIRFDENLSGDAPGAGLITKDLTIVLPPSRKVVFRNVAMSVEAGVSLILKNATMIRDRSGNPNSLFNMGAKANAKLYNVVFQTFPIGAFNGSQLEIYDSLIHKIELAEDVRLVVNNSTFYGGSPAISARANSTVSVVNSTFYQNGGVFYGSQKAGIPSSRPKFFVTQSTLVPNVTMIFYQSDVELSNTLVYMDTSALYNDYCKDSTIQDRGSNLFTKQISICNSNIRTGIVKLGPLQDNGGPTPTVALLPGSEDAIGKGDVSVCASALLGGRDQRGALLTLIEGKVSACDIGAFQSKATINLSSSSK